MILHELIEAQAQRTPDAPAVAFEGAKLSYAGLEQRASRLARELQRRGAGPEARVALFLERSLEVVVAILGILKSGAAYVPIDPAYPQERVRFMVTDAGARLAVSQSALAARLAVETIAIDTLDRQGDDKPLDHAVRPENLAYVIYTSGSTGRPKGVCIEHRNIVNYVRGVAERLELEPGMHHAMVSTVAADLGNTVLFPALASGGCLHVISQARAGDGALLGEYFARERIDVLKIVPSHLAALQSGRADAALMPARRLVLGGEASRLDWIASLRALAPRCVIFNHYGPTEATVGALTYRVGAELANTPTGALPLGKPLPGSRVYVLDESGAPVKPGERGEIHIGGAGVARGYLGRPELTAERFVPERFCAEDGARLYRTGDLARELADGSLEFCGRADHQVKVHGFRVELGEIESTLKACGGVRDAVVIARENERGEKELVACVVSALATAGLREHLKERLPPYMVPSAFVRLERLPLNANGKVDRQALAALAPEAPQAAGDFAAPRSATESALAAIWSELLGLERVGIHDDVFDLGAHSLMAMKALARIRDSFEVNLALRNLFERPTVAALGELVDGLASLAQPAARRGAAAGREEITL
jgi:amino acid adenylation domain-containing protein